MNKISGNAYKKMHWIFCNHNFTSRGLPKKENKNSPKKEKKKNQNQNGSTR